MSVRSKPLAAFVGVAIAALGLGVAASGSVAAAAPDWETVFRDDFNGSGLPDPANWLLTLGTSYPGGPAGFGTGEIETMTNDPSNVDVRNGNLYITPQRDTAGAWTSARVETTRADFKAPVSGIMHVESRLQMPNVTGNEAKGYWPAFWMLGGPYRADRWSWPRVGEFDIMENVQGYNWTYNVLHCGTWGGPCNEPEGINNGRAGNSGEPCQVTTCQAGFHTYAMEWDTTGAADQLRWYLDGALTFTVNENQVPAQTWTDLADHAGYFIILNVAMGGAFPNKLDGNGGPFATTRPGVPMVVDYVEVKYAGGQGGPTTPTDSTAPPTGSTPTGSTPTGSTPTGSTPTGSTPTGTNPIVTDPPPPPRDGPSDLRVTSTTGSTITIGWDGPTASSYDILRSGERIATVTGRSFTDVGLLPNTPYLYSVRGNGITTPVLSTTLDSTQPLTPSSIPRNLRVTGTTPSTITLAWDGSAGTSYEVLRSGIRIATVTTTGFQDVGLFRDTPYLYSVRAGGITTPVLTSFIR